MDSVNVFLQSGLGLWLVPFFFLAGIYLTCKGFEWGLCFRELAAGFVCILLAVVLIAGYFATQPTCPACGKIAKTDYCTSCGQLVEENIDPTCPECGEVCRTDFCGSCGTPINPEG